MNASERTRPHAVVAFETLCIVVLGFELAFVWGLSWDELLWTPLMLWIVLSVTRRKSSVARWVFTALYVGGFVFAAYVAAIGSCQSNGN